MNLDFKIPASGAAARRVQYASEIMNIAVSEEILKHLSDDLISSDTIKHAIPVELSNKLTDTQCEVVQFAADCFYRCMVITNTKIESSEQLLIAALVSGKPLLIFSELHRHINNAHDSWVAILTKFKIPYYLVKTDGVLPPEAASLVLLIDTFSDVTNILQTDRHRILLYSQHCRSIPSSPGQPGEGTNLIDLAKEFKSCIFGCFNNMDGWANTQHWSASPGFSMMVNTLHCDTSISKLFYRSGSHRKSDNCSPEHVGMMLNVNTQLINKSISYITKI